jgi:hypothetical protein
MRWRRVLFIAVVSCALLLLAGRAALTVRDAAMSDFRCFYEGGRLVRLGLDPYDRATWAAATGVDVEPHPPCAETFYYPLWTAMAMVPLSELSEPDALAVWEVVLVLCAVAGTVMLAKAWRPFGGNGLLLALVLCSQPMFSAVANAQFGPVVFFGLAALGLALDRSRDRLAAIAWAILLIKPNIIVGVLVGAPLLRSRRFAASALAAGLVIFVASLLVVPTWPIDAARVILGQQLLIDRDLGTFWSFAIVLGLPSVIGTAVAVVALFAFAWALPRRPFAPHELVAILTVASFLITPYARAHDEIALALCWGSALALARVAPAERAQLVGGALAIGLGLPWLVTVLSLAGAPLAAHVLVTVASAALLAYALRGSAPVTEARAVREVA